MKKLSAFFNRIIASKGFLRVISLLIAVALWYYIVMLVSPDSTKTFTGIPVDLRYENSIAANNDLMMILTDSDIKVAATLTGARSEVRLTQKDDISAYLDMSSITASGTYELKVFLDYPDKLSLAEATPSYITIEFDRKVKANIPIEVRYVGEAKNGYVVTGTALSAQYVEVVGPQKFVEKLTKAVCEVSLDGKTQSFTTSAKIKVLSGDTTEVNSQFFTYSISSVSVNTTMEYQREVGFKANLVNPEGGTETQIMSVRFEPYSLLLAGPEEALKGLDTVFVGDIDVSDIYEKQSIVFDLSDILPDGVTAVNGDTTITAIVDASRVFKQTLTLTEEYLIENVYLENFDESNGIPTFTKDVKMTVRGEAGLTPSDFTYSIDLSDTAENGVYVLNATPKDGVFAGFIGDTFVSMMQVLPEPLPEEKL